MVDHDKEESVFSYLKKPGLEEVITSIKEDFVKGIKESGSRCKWLCPPELNQHLFEIPYFAFPIGCDICPVVNVVYDKNIGIAWPGHEEPVFDTSLRPAFYKEVIVSHPEEYLKIRDNYDELKKFVGETLDKGIRLIVPDTPNSLIDDRTEYVVSSINKIFWLYSKTNNLKFKNNLENVIVELLNEELNKKFKSEKEFSSVDDDVTAFDLLYDDNIGERYEGVPNTAFNRQFNRLSGLLEFITLVGTPNNRFAELSSLLKERAEDPYFKDSSGSSHPFPEYSCMECKLLLALSSVQKPGELDDAFWKKRILKEKNANTIYASARGFVINHSSAEKKKRLFEVLKLLDSRGDKKEILEKKLNHRYFHTEPLRRALLVVLGRQVYNTLINNNKAFTFIPRGIFVNEDKKHNVYFIKSNYLKEDLFEFHVDMFSKNGLFEDLKVISDLNGKKFTGPSYLKGPINDFIEKSFDPDGYYPLSEDNLLVHLFLHKVSLDYNTDHPKGKVEGEVSFNIAFPFFGHMDRGIFLSFPIKYSFNPNDCLNADYKLLVGFPEEYSKKYGDSNKLVPIKNFDSVVKEALSYVKDNGLYSPTLEALQKDNLEKVSSEIDYLFNSFVRSRFCG